MPVPREAPPLPHRVPVLRGRMPRDGWRTVAPALAVAILLPAVFLVPAALRSGTLDPAHLAGPFRSGFAAYWESGRPEFPAGLEAVVALWFRFHLVKAGVAALLLAAAVALTLAFRRRAGRAAAAGARARRPALAGAWGAGLVAVFAGLVLVANLQGAAAPFASLLPGVTAGGRGSVAADAVAEARTALAGGPEAHSAAPPALTAMLDGFARYHAVLLAAALVTALVLAVLTVRSWRRRAARATDSAGTARRRARPSFLLPAGGVVVALVLAYANLTNTLDPAPGLTGLLTGGW
ncbi:tat (twin-arginine translocation) pathway signal sequence [Streptomyces sp. NPDC097619]|uniref:tat (twin-arginine translocation) pathway signal sequence n=1 Tax=Streptomyces sp. NPDC097619 TaxID=3157228 RepID=UPI00332BEEFF